MKLTAEQQTELVKRYLREVLQRDLQRRQQNDTRPVLPYGGDYTEKELTDIEELLSFSLNAQKNKEYSGLQDVLRPVVIDGAKQLFKVELKEAEHSKAQIKANDSATDRAIKEILAYHEITAENDEKEINALTFQLAQGLQRDVIPVMMKRAKGDFTAEQQQVSTVSQSDVIDVDSGPRLFEVIEAYLKHKKEQGLKDSTITAYRQTLKHLKAVCEDIPIEMIDAKAMREIREKFRAYAKGKNWKLTNLKQKQTDIHAFIKESRNEGFSFCAGIEEIFDVTPKGTTAGIDESKRVGFTESELRTLFSEENYRFNQGASFARCYWLPLIILFEGMRLGEISQLTTDSIKQDENGIYFIDVSSDVKNKQSARRTPLMSSLIELGFLDYVERCKRDKKTLLFSNKKTASGYSSEFFNRLTKRLNLKKSANDGDTSFHSLRHSFASIAIKAKIPERLIQNFLGHEQGKSTLMRHYVDKATVKELYDAFKDLHFPIDIEAIKRNWKAPENYFSRKGKTRKKDDSKSK